MPADLKQFVPSSGLVAASTKHLVPGRRVGMVQNLCPPCKFVFVVGVSVEAYKGLVAAEMSAFVS